MYDNFGALDTAIQEKIDADTDFQTSLADLSDEDKQTALETKKSELLDSEVKSLSKNKEVADNYKTRAEKAEADLKKSKPTSDDLTQKDFLVLAKADVDEEDVEEVIEFAKFKKLSVSDALKNDSLKAILEDRSEKRKSAATAAARPQRQGQQKVTDDTVLDKALNKDQLPDKGSDDAEALYRARRGIK